MCPYYLPAFVDKSRKSVGIRYAVSIVETSFIMSVEVFTMISIGTDL